MGVQVKGKTTFKAWGYRAYSANFAEPLGPAKVPGAAARGERRRDDHRPLPQQARHAGDDAPARARSTRSTWTAPTRASTPTRAGSSRRATRSPTSGRPSRARRAPGGTTTTGRASRCRVYKGLFGPIIVRDPNKPQPDKEFFVGFHSFQPAATGLDQPFYCINGQRLRRATRRPSRPTSATTSPSTSTRSTTTSTRSTSTATAGSAVGGTDDRQRHARPRRRDDRPLHRGQPRPLALPLPRLEPHRRGDERLVHRRMRRARGSRCCSWRRCCSCCRRLPTPRTAGSRSATTSGPTDDLNLDLGEHVTWYWTGPDTMHSVTGQPPNAGQWDSDPGSLPKHNIGDNYQLTFDQPGIYALPVQDPLAGRAAP